MLKELYIFRNLLLQPLHTKPIPIPSQMQVCLKFFEREDAIFIHCPLPHNQPPPSLSFSLMSLHITLHIFHYTFHFLTLPRHPISSISAFGCLQERCWDCECGVCARERESGVCTCVCVCVCVFCVCIFVCDLWHWVRLTTTILISFQRRTCRSPRTDSPLPSLCGSNVEHLKNPLG